MFPVPKGSTQKNVSKGKIIAGIDEVGRGCIAGPVVACCLAVNSVNLNEKNGSKILCELLAEVRDSKKLTKSRREELFAKIKNLQSLGLLHFGIGKISPKIIDQINILNATKQAMHQSYINLRNQNQTFAEEILVDGNFIPFAKQDKINEMRAIIGGDDIEPLISAASIVAKVWRDFLMNDIAEQFPQYGFEKHVGYGTKFHIDKIKKFGPTKIHRFSFEPIKSMINS